MGIRNSIKKKVKRFDQSVYDLTELGYNLRVIFMKTLYEGGSFSDMFVENISSIIGELVVEFEASSSLVRIEVIDITDYDEMINNIDKAYMNTLYQCGDEVNEILLANDISVPIKDIPIMTNITRYGNSINIVL